MCIRDSMYFHDAFSKKVDPSFCRSDATCVADVEVPADPFAIDRVQIIDGLLRGHDEVVSDVFDGDFHTGVPGDWDCLLNFHDGTLKTLLVSHAVAGDTGNQQHTRSAVGLRILQALHEAIETDLARRFVRRGKRLEPVGM